MRSRGGRLDLAVIAVLGAGVAVMAALVALQLRGAPSHPAAVLMGWWLVPYAIAAAWVLWRPPPRRVALVLVFAVALAARAAMVGEAPTLSSDVYRYVWDGRVQAAGINPYLHPPESPALVALRDEEVYPFINRRAVPTAYPPAAELAFRAIYAVEADSVVWTKLVLVAVDMGVIALVAWLLGVVGMPPQRTLLYAWHPLAIFEVAYGGHVEILLVALALGALAAALVPRRRAGATAVLNRARRSAAGALTGALLAAATLVKPYALLVSPALAARAGVLRLAAMVTAFSATAALLYVPYLSAGGGVLGYIPGYLTEEGFVSGERFHLAARAAELVGIDAGVLIPWYLGVAGVVLAGLALHAWLAPLPAPAAVPRRALVLFLTVLVIATPRYPWYGLLALALLPFARGALLLAGAATVSVTPLLYAHLRTAGNPQWPLDVVYGTGAAALLAAAIWWLARRVWAWRRRPAETPAQRAGTVTTDPGRA